MTGCSLESLPSVPMVYLPLSWPLMSWPSNLTATFSTGTVANVPGEKKGNNANGTFHWTVFTPAGATLIDAFTDTSGSSDVGTTQVAGNLLLSNCVKKG